MANLILFLWSLMLSYVIDKVHGRVLKLNVSTTLISDGIDAVGMQPPLFNWDSSSPHSSKCVHVYNFFPCADNIGGYIFQIVVYQYLLIIGGKLITNGSKTLFNILGTGVYGASVFRILTVLPKMVMVIVSGVLKSKENAQVKVSFGVGVYAGSTVFNLTFLWGMCVIFGRKELFAKPDSTGSPVSKCLMAKETLSQLKDTGITVDLKTCYTAGIMLLSLIPYTIVQFTYFFDTLFGIRMVILIALIVSTALLLSYFLYQIFDPWIQERSLEYSKYENLLAGFLQHVQRHAKEKLIDESGRPNIPVIKRLFSQTDKDADNCITFLELENLILEIQSGKVEVEKDYAISEILKAFDLNSDGRIEEHEFIEGCTKWINDAMKLADKGDSTSRNFLRKVVQPFAKKEIDELTEVEHPMARILKHAKSQELEAKYLVTDDGRPDVESIKVLFKQFDTDNSNSLSRSELEQLIHNLKYGEGLVNNNDEMVEKLMKDFDTDGNSIIDEQEFVHGVTKWLNKAISATKRKDIESSIEIPEKIMWGEVDNLVYEGGKKKIPKFKLLTRDFNKSLLEVILGIAILTFLSGPLMTSIQQFSDSIGVPSFFISFVIVPVAMNARSAISAIFPASQKSSRTSSLTFSEVYIPRSLKSISLNITIVLYSATGHECKNSHSSNLASETTVKELLCL